MYFNIHFQKIIEKLPERELCTFSIILSHLMQHLLTTLLGTVQNLLSVSRGCHGDIVEFHSVSTP